MTSFATELATPNITDVRADTLPRLIYKDANLFVKISKTTVSCRQHSVKKTFLCYVALTSIEALLYTDFLKVCL